MNPAIWSNFLVAQAGAAAALTGLIFVAVSINLSKILEYPGVSTRAAESIILLLGVVLNSSLALVPSQPLRALGAEILFVGSVIWAVITYRHITSPGRSTTSGGGLPCGWCCANWRRFPFALPELLLSSAGRAPCIGSCLAACSRSSTEFMEPGCCWWKFCGSIRRGTASQ